MGQHLVGCLSPSFVLNIYKRKKILFVIYIKEQELLMIGNNSSCALSIYNYNYIFLKKR